MSIENTSLAQGGFITAELKEYVTSVRDTGIVKNIRFQFPNGYGASVSDLGAYASAPGYELAVTDADGKLCYDTEIANDVLPGLSGQEVCDYLCRIMKL
jgi:hypothetical protein